MPQGHTETEKKAPLYVDPMELLGKFREGNAYAGTIKFRGGEIDLRILTRDEEMDIRRKAIKHASAYGGDETEKNDFIQRYTISLASNINGQPTLPITLFSKMTGDEFDFLHEEYIKIRDDNNPSLEKMTMEQYEALVDAVKKNAVGWKDLSLRQLRAIFSAYQALIQRQADPQ